VIRTGREVQSANKQLIIVIVYCRIRLVDHHDSTSCDLLPRQSTVAPHHAPSERVLRTMGAGGSSKILVFDSYYVRYNSRLL